MRRRFTQRTVTALNRGFVPLTENKLGLCEMKSTALGNIPRLFPFLIHPPLSIRRATLIVDLSSWTWGAGNSAWIKKWKIHAAGHRNNHVSFNLVAAFFRLPSATMFTFWGLVVNLCHLCNWVWQRICGSCFGAGLLYNSPLIIFSRSYLRKSTAALSFVESSIRTFYPPFFELIRTFAALLLVDS